MNDGRAWIAATLAALLSSGALAQDAATEPGPAPAGIEAQPLGGLDLFSAGARRTDLPPDLWRGTSAALASEVFDRLGSAPLSPAARDLALRVLATGASAPDRAGADVQLAAARVRALLALGDAAGVDAILDRTAGVGESAALSQVAAEAVLFLEQPDEACRIGQALRTGRDEPYFVRLRAFCEARAGRAPAAQLALRLLEESGGRDEPFGRLIGAVTNATPPGAASLRTGLHAALSRQLELNLAPAVETAAPAALANLASKAGPARAPAAARALRLGLISAEAAAAYAPSPAAPAAEGATPEPTAAPTPADVAAALTQTGAARERALYRLTLADVPAVRAAAVAGLLARSEPAEFLAGVRLAEPALRTLSPEAAGARALLFARAAAVLPDAALAARFRAAAPADAGFEAAVTDALIAIAGDKALPVQALESLLPLAEAASPDRSRAQGAVLLMAAAGAPVPPASRAALLRYEAGAADAAGARRLALDLAADAGIRGEAALIALDIALDAGAAGPKLADRVEIVRALREARVPGHRTWAREGLLQLLATQAAVAPTSPSRAPPRAPAPPSPRPAPRTR
jgi:hypothetical protein